MDQKNGKKYIAFFKCRMCGTTFSAGDVVNHIVAEQCIQFAVTTTRMMVQQNPEGSMRLYPHECENGSYGIADLLGMKIVSGGKEK